MTKTTKSPIVVQRVADLRALVRGFREDGSRVALVPTMGALHEGHLALIRAGQALCRRTIATIFVNPTQFGPAEDFASYPRDATADLAKLSSVGTDAVFMPSVEEMYPPAFYTSILVSHLTDRLCGPFRPGHFSGVATVVAKLLMQALPDVALLGEKDYQQLLVIKRLVRDLDLPVQIVGVPTVREADGLALSSRNRYLSPAERSIAPLLHGVISRLGEDLADGAPAKDLVSLRRAELEQLGFTPVQYLEVLDSETLEPPERLDRPARVFVAAYLGKTRLIDNVPIKRRK